MDLYERYELNYARLKKWEPWIFLVMGICLLVATAGCAGWWILWFNQ